MRTWKHITTHDDVHRAVKILDRYCGQSYVDDWGVKQPARFAVDCETFRTDGDRTKFPRPIWNGKDWDFRFRLISIGLDVIQDFELRDKQLLFDVKDLGVKYVKAAIQDYLEATPCIGHSAHYDDGCLDSIDIHPKWIDTKLLGQVLLSGKKATHYLHDYYRRCISKSKFLELTGMTHDEYIETVKKAEQKSDWGVPVLTIRQKNYAADDVRLLWYVWDSLGEKIEDHEKKYEKNFPESKGIQIINNLEHKVLPVFVGMEQRGIRFARQYHKDVVIPLLEERRDEARDQFKRWKEFRKPRKKGSYSLCYLEDLNTGAEKTDVTVLSKQIRSEIYRSISKHITGLSVTTKKHADGDRVFIRWTDNDDIEEGVNTSDSVQDIASLFLDGIYKPFDDSLITLNHALTLQKAISSVMGFKVTTSKAKYLRRLLPDCDARQAEILTWILRYNKARTYSSKFGRNFLQHLTARGYFHPKWHQIGSDHKEIVSGRSSCSDPPLMQMPSRDKLFTYASDGGIGAAELLRSLILPPVGGAFVNADYSAIEPRLIAWITGDRRLREALRLRVDLHKLTAGILKKFGEAEIPDDVDLTWLVEDITPEERKNGKILNLGIGYLMGPGSLVDHIWDMTDGQVVWDVKQARRNIDKWFEFFSGVAAYIDKVEAKVCRRVYAENSVAFGQGGYEPLGTSFAMDGRHRHLYLPQKLWKVDPDTLSLDYNPERKRYFYNEGKARVGKMRRDGWNLEIQATAASMLKWAEVYVDRALNKEFADHPKWNPRVFGLHLVLHDELLVSVPDDPESIALGRKIVEREMLRAAAKFVDFDVVPIEVGISSGENWFAASPK